MAREAEELRIFHLPTAYSNGVCQASMYCIAYTNIDIDGVTPSSFTPSIFFGAWPLALDRICRLGGSSCGWLLV